VENEKHTEASGLAVFIDFENLALGFHYQRRKEKFDLQKVLTRLLEKGRILVKKAYADWARYREHKTPLHEAAFELIDIPKRRTSGKNSADIRMCVDALDLAHSNPHVDTFVIVSGDSDFSPLVSKLRENAKHVIGLGMKGSTSDLLVDVCDEFIFYEDLELPAPAQATIPASLAKVKREAMTHLIDAIGAMVRENIPVMHSSHIKETIKRKRPQFSESYHGYRSFSEFLEHAEELGLLELRTDSKSGTYVVTRLTSQKRR
jgi:uncharacterized protein (TIGR00288 family)